MAEPIMYCPFSTWIRQCLTFPSALPTHTAVRTGRGQHDDHTHLKEMEKALDCGDCCFCSLGLIRKAPSIRTLFSMSSASCRDSFSWNHGFPTHTHTHTHTSHHHQPTGHTHLCGCSAEALGCPGSAQTWGSSGDSPARANTQT